LETRKIAVVGSRDGVNPVAVSAFIDKLDPLTTVIVSGGARGVDTYAAERAEERGIKTVVIRPNWKKYGRGAGFLRNKEIVKAADDVVAFWNGRSRGTEHTIEQAVKLGRSVAIFGVDGKLIRFIPGGQPQRAAQAIPHGKPTYKGPAQPERHQGRPERRERRQQEHKARRDARKVDGRLKEQGVWLP